MDLNSMVDRINSETWVNYVHYSPSEKFLRVFAKGIFGEESIEKIPAFVEKMMQDKDSIPLSEVVKNKDKWDPFFFTLPASLKVEFILGDEKQCDEVLFAPMVQIKVDGKQTFHLVATMIGQEGSQLVIEALKNRGRLV